jgi:1,2-diacylglycerol-3-alpha-glucose alpha-1,2-galactosyltransferase
MTEGSWEGSLRIPSFLLFFAKKYLYSFYKNADSLVVVNSYFQKELVEKGLDSDKIVYIPNYADESIFFPVGPQEKKRFREELSLPVSTPIIMSSGQVQKRKGFGDFINVARQNPDYYFVWVGGFSFGKLTDGYTEYRKIIENPPSNVCLTGIIPRDQVAHYLQASDIFFLASFQELFPMSILEAVKCGLPVLLRDIPLYKTILFDDYFCATDVEGFSKNLRTVIDTVTRYQEGKDSSKHLAGVYSEKNILLKWENLYERLYRL